MTEFTTNDISLAAYFLTQGISLQGTNRTDEKIVEFLFFKTPELIKLSRQYWNNQALVSPLEYSFKIRFLKKLIFQNHN